MVRIDQTDRGQLAQRPARWNGDNEMQVMDLTHPEVWGVAMSVNAHDVALVSLHKGLQGDNGILLWNEDGSADNITPASQNIIPMGIDDNGTIIGFVNVKRRSSGRDSAPGSELGATWILCGLLSHRYQQRRGRRGRDPARRLPGTRHLDKRHPHLDADHPLPRMPTAGDQQPRRGRRARSNRPR
jgi:hypothetical protein